MKSHDLSLMIKYLAIILFMLHKKLKTTTYE